MTFCLSNFNCNSFFFDSGLLFYNFYFYYLFYFHLIFMNVYLLEYIAICNYY
ncbi:hypothetical protein BCR36DRAFT_153350 [Piromyces finnis]|uniref:Uncharacterized protein n=1 Tax=Piromyces finnis TaxID=1754191 RepID=A0A1Y1VII1_9FUNG|nr:hypothetical protein BCR36DRAFT_153350 [Piromyces finnis]|eukprot:ORX57215.1 hypothetical protein BCR36DRAFT_153350 [Piromyces finnis]